MAQDVSLEQAVSVLIDKFGAQFTAGFDEGKSDMAAELRSKMGLSEQDAKATIEALVAARTIRWFANSDAMPNQEGTMGMVIEDATWFLGKE